MEKIPTYTAVQDGVMNELSRVIKTTLKAQSKDPIAYMLFVFSPNGDGTATPLVASNVNPAGYLPMLEPIIDALWGKRKETLS